MKFKVLIIYRLHLYKYDINILCLFVCKLIFLSFNIPLYYTCLWHDRIWDRTLVLFLLRFKLKITYQIIFCDDRYAPFIGFIVHRYHMLYISVKYLTNKFIVCVCMCVCLESALILAFGIIFMPIARLSGIISRRYYMWKFENILIKSNERVFHGVSNRKRFTHIAKSNWESIPFYEKSKK